MAVRHISSEQFRQMVWDYSTSKDWKFAGTRPAVVDFYASWCGPCRMLSPVIDSLEAQYAGKVDFYKVDTDSEPELCEVFGIQSIPSLLFCSPSQEPKMTRGVLPESSLKEIIDSL